MIAAGRFRSHTTHAVRQLDDRRPLRKTLAGVPVRASARAPVAALASETVVRVLRRRPRRPVRPPWRPRCARPVRQKMERQETRVKRQSVAKRQLRVDQIRSTPKDVKIIDELERTLKTVKKDGACWGPLGKVVIVPSGRNDLVDTMRTTTLCGSEQAP